MEVIVITSSSEKEKEIPQIVRLFDNGLNTLHLRKPKWNKKEIRSFIESIPKEHHNKIVVHGHYDLAIKYTLKGIHLHRRHRNSKLKNRWNRLLMKLKHPKLIITSTFNSIESLRENTLSLDYVFLYSVFTSHSYYNKDEESGVNLLRSILSKANIPVYALGGVTKDRIEVVRPAGFKGVGLSSAVWKHIDKNPEEVLSIIQAA